MNPLLQALVQAGLVDKGDANRIEKQLDSNIARQQAEAEMLQAFQVGLSGQRDRLLDAVRASDGLLSATAQNKLWAAENDLLWNSVKSTILDVASERATVAAIHVGSIDTWHLINEKVIQDAERYYLSTAVDDFGSIPNLNATSRAFFGDAFNQWQRGEVPISEPGGLPDLIRLLQTPFGVNRATGIATTETSRIFAFSELSAARANEFVESLIWQTGNDELTCPICQPLNGMVVGKETNGFQMTVGSTGWPPAHPRCRCAISSLTGPAREALREQGLAQSQ